MAQLFSRWFNRRRYLIAQADESRDQNRPAEAADLYRKIIDEWGEKPWLLMQLGNSLKDSANYEKAYATYIRVWESKDRNADVALQLGHLFKLQGDFANSRKWYCHSIELDRNDNNPAHQELISFNTHSGSAASTDDSSDLEVLSFPEEAILRHFRTELQYRLS